MKVTEITVNEDGVSVNAMTRFSANELNTLLQFAINTAASIGLTAELKARMTKVAEDDAPRELND